MGQSETQLNPNDTSFMPM